jgi:hypothetical protein
MTEETTATGVVPPRIGEALTAGVNTFKAHAKILLQAFGIFLGGNLLLGAALQLLAGKLGTLLAFALSLASILPSLLLLPGLYAIALKCVRGRKAELRDLLVMFDERFIHHVGTLMLQSCGALVCCVGALATQALFIPGSFMVIDRRQSWDGAMQLCVEHVKPKIVPWLLFHLAVAAVALAGVVACLVGSLFTGPIALCAWAYAYDKAFGGASPAGA